MRVTLWPRTVMQPFISSCCSMGQYLAMSSTSESCRTLSAARPSLSMPGQLLSTSPSIPSNLPCVALRGDYTYDELLNRVFEIIRDKNPEMAGGRKPKFVMRPPPVLRVGTKKTSFASFTEICKTLHRLQKHLLDFLLAELGTSGSVDGNNQLIIKGRFQPKQIENVLRRYIKEYVTCHTCRSPDTILQKDTRFDRGPVLRFGVNIVRHFC